ncbi:MAG: RsmD family RNA methyltransferase, partial [Nitrospirota bacterium]
VFVDKSEKAAKLIRENLDALGYRERGMVVAKDALTFLRKTAPALGPFDLVFVDPPYHEEAGHKAMSELGEEPPSKSALAEPTENEAAGIDAVRPAALSPGAVVVFEHFKKLPAPEAFGRLVKRRDYSYGDTVLSLYYLNH